MQWCFVLLLLSLSAFADLTAPPNPLLKDTKTKTLPKKKTTLFPSHKIYCIDKKGYRHEEGEFSGPECGGIGLEKKKNEDENGLEEDIQ